MTRIGLVSLGCPKALVDSEVMAGVLKKRGMELCQRSEDADIIVINTCGFLQASTEESMATIETAEKLKKEGKCRGVVVAGCLVERYSDRILRKYPQVDALLGTSHFEEIAIAVEKILAGEKYRALSHKRNLLSHESPIHHLTPEHYSYVKIAEGCDHPCRFCVIPRIKGRHQSRTIEDIEKEVSAKAETGTREIILVAQDTTDYGRDIYQEQRLPQLLKRLAQIDGIDWIRILYAYPSYVTDELINVMAEEPKICKYLDMPLQHAHDDMLQAMARMGTRGEYLALIQKMRERISGLALRTTFIVGFPGETEEHFQSLLAFVENIKFERLGVFNYSREPGTYSDKMDHHVPEDVKERRRREMMLLQQEISQINNRRWIGKEIKMMVDGRAEDSAYLLGRAYFDAPEIDGSIYVEDRDHQGKTGDLVDIKIIDALEYDLVGQLIPCRH